MSGITYLKNNVNISYKLSVLVSTVSIRPIDAANLDPWPELPVREAEEASVVIFDTSTLLSQLVITLRTIQYKNHDLGLFNII
jgi:hypothetical protein